MRYPRLLHPSPLILVLMLTAGAPQPLRAQQQEAPEVHLSVAEALELAHERNFDIRSSRSETEVARAESRKARAAFLPRLSVSEIVTTTNDPLNAFGFKLQQEIVTPADFDPARLNDPDRIDQFTTRFEFSQPVLNAGGIFQHRAARTRSRAAAHMTERTRHHIDFEVRQRYYRLVLARRSLTVLDSALSAARANREQAGQFFDQGLITRADLLEADVRVLDLESKRTGAAFEILNVSDALRYLLGIDEQSIIVPTDSLEVHHPSIGTIDVNDVNQQRSDMEALRLRIAEARHMLSSSRTQFMPDVNVFGRYDLNDQNLFGSSGDSWTFGATLRWNLFAGFQQIGSVQRAKANLRTSEIAYERLTLQNEVDLAAAVRGIEQTSQQVELARTAVTQARENLRIRADRYAQGLEKTTDVLNAEVTLANQNLAYLETLYRHYVNIFRLELLLERPVL